ncbi:MAG: hypothetical protein NC911_10180 [Candidatus Omnitrophica bacterium]|nr:hypothetical protein [Candidatus Omnitrophota bacterium]
MLLFFCYDLLFFLYLIFCFPWLWRRIRPEKQFLGDWRERFGFISQETTKRITPHCLWFQTVSVGELLSISPLVKILREHYPGQALLLTVTTKSGRTLAAKQFPAIPCLFFPLDFSPIVSAFLRLVKPRLVVLVETEIWPNLIRLCYHKKIPVVIVNGRLSPRSFRWYRRFRFFLRQVLPRLTEVAMRTQQEAERLIFLGARKEKIRVVGSIKFDQAYALSTRIDPEKVRKSYGISANQKIVVFGSLHPGEEPEIVRVTKKLGELLPEVLSIIAPRFLDRTGIFTHLKTAGLDYTSRSHLPQGSEKRVWVVDTYGELNNFYSLCQVAFVGGSLVPWGGQNPIEPASFRKPVIFGQYSWHFFEEWERIKSAGGGIEVHSFEELLKTLVFLLQQPDLSQKMGERAFQAVLTGCGATQRNLEMLAKYL